jgi:hypothetical protein
MNLNKLLIWFLSFETIIFIWSHFQEYILSTGLSHVFNFIGFYTGDYEGFYRFP